MISNRHLIPFLLLHCRKNALPPCTPTKCYQYRSYTTGICKELNITEVEKCVCLPLDSILQNPRTIPNIHIYILAYHNWLQISINIDTCSIQTALHVLFNLRLVLLDEYKYVSQKATFTIMACITLCDGNL